jgi:hypothetical protein
MRILRLAGFLTGAAILVWIPFEDTTAFWVSAFAIAICTLVGAGLFANRRILGSWKQPARGAIVGALAGLAVAPLAIGLMAFKSGIHGHGFPDFSPTQMQEVINLLPYFTVAGLVCGLGVAFLTRKD